MLIAAETFRLKQPLTVGKTIIRSVIKNIGKEVGKEATKDALADQGAGGLIAGILLGLAADIAVDATENADLRISQFFPATAQSCRSESRSGNLRCCHRILERKISDGSGNQAWCKKPSASTV